MNNEILWLGMLLLNFALILLSYKVFGAVGLIAWVALAGIIANIQVTKTVELFGLTATLGNIVYATSFLATDILNERYGAGMARRTVWIGFAAIVSATLLMTMAIQFIPAAGDTMAGPLRDIFSLLPRITVASLMAYIFAQLHDVWAFDFWRRRVPEKLWVRNNLSTAVSQAIDSLVFTSVAFIGVFPASVFLEILLTTYVLKLLVAVLDTPMIYISRKVRPVVQWNFNATPDTVT